ncbi:Phenylacetate-coenzyme A ligase PaaK, adenylate-forming domain family [Ruminococcaceae bacterium KH2T8]|nr:Phenylacetate-coenzyme A ligase PaaK, adenylate-forming domain family [Ruminococcaceae bacterium KH2T8]
MTFDDVIKNSPYSLDQASKEKILTERLLSLTSAHRASCKPYDNILRTLGYDSEAVRSYKDIPFLPVRLFKELELKSVADDQIVKTMTSSGTSGQSVSKIFLDRTTASNQQKAMVKIVSSFTGSERMPMIIIDCPSVIKTRNLFSARGAGILGFSIFGTKKMYALRDDMSLDVDNLKEFLESHRGERILLFGFTFMIWQYFYKELIRLKEQGITFDLSDAILIHGGGWKKLIGEAVSPDAFKKALKDVCSLERIHDYYGMVEQTGCIYMQCECGHLHTSVFSDVIIRDHKDFSECENGRKGIIQVVSTIPESYPGHSLLTEDEGEILGVDDCPCGRKGKYFRIYGRLKDAEIRGCSDTFAASVSGESDHAGVEYLIGNEEVISKAQKTPPLVPFADEVIRFCNDISSCLMKSDASRRYPDVVTLGFWLRRSSVMKMKETYLKDDGRYRLGRGLAFHIAPSNVPVNYAYSLFSGLLCGNANIVRIPSKDFPQIRIINDSIRTVLDSYPNLKDYITLVRYERSKEINDRFSAVCDLRVIWGGDATIAALRESQIPPRATEVAFADRYSLALIDSDEFMSRAEESSFSDRFAKEFYNDTYLSDQNACTSPRVIIWMGKSIVQAKRIMWDSVKKLAEREYELKAVQSVDKLTDLCLVSSRRQDVAPKIVDKYGNSLYRISLDSLDPQLMDHRGNSGFFFEYDCTDINEIRDICNDERCQTLAILGATSIVTPLFDSGVKGIDRIVDFGHTMDFDLIWDGYNLIEHYTRVVDLRR